MNIHPRIPRTHMYTYSIVHVYIPSCLCPRYAACISPNNSNAWPSLWWWCTWVVNFGTWRSITATSWLYGSIHPASYIPYMWHLDNSASRHCNVPNCGCMENVKLRGSYMYMYEKLLLTHTHSLTHTPLQSKLPPGPGESPKSRKGLDPMLYCTEWFMSVFSRLVRERESKGREGGRKRVSTSSSCPGPSLGVLCLECGTCSSLKVQRFSSRLPWQYSISVSALQKLKKRFLVSLNWPEHFVTFLSM